MCILCFELMKKLRTEMYMEILGCIWFKFFFLYVFVLRMRIRDCICIKMLNVMFVGSRY